MPGRRSRTQAHTSSLVFTTKSLHRRLACQVSPSGKDACHPSSTPGVEEEKGWGDTTPTAPLNFDYEEEDDGIFNPLISENEEGDDGHENDTKAILPLSSVKLEVYKCAAAQQDVPWPVVVAEAPRCRYV